MERVAWRIPTRDRFPSDAAAAIAALTSEIAALRKSVDSQTERIGELTTALAARDLRIAELEKLLDDSRRSGKRQAAPFSKGEPADEPKTPGRRSGKEHGRHGHRRVPVAPIDRELQAPLPSCCPECGGSVIHERDEEQFHTELPSARPVVTRFTVGVGRCTKCKRRLQGRHPEQTSDALGAAGSQVGPHAKNLAIWLHYALGLSFAKTARLLGHLGVPVTAGAICSAQTTGTDLVPTQNVLRRCEEMITDLPDWARGTPRHVKNILLAALDARDLPAPKRRAVATDLAERIELLAEQSHPHYANRRLIKHLINEADALFSFLSYDADIDATNWRGEQAIRPAVVNRKGWGGNRTWRGAASQGRIMSAIRTATQQGIDSIGFLVRLARAPDSTTVSLFA